MSKTMKQCARMASVISLAAWSVGVAGLQAQVPTDAEVRQLVTFRFLPGKSAEALALFREQALPLYRQDQAMLSFRAFREVESPVPLDLIVVSAFRGMAGMDESNASLRALAEEAGTSIGAIYGGIGALSSSHHDQFIEMLAPFRNGDPSSKRLVALVWYRAKPEHARALLGTLEQEVLSWEREQGIPSSTGRFLVSDGWEYLRFIGFESLGDYQEYWSRVGQIEALDAYTAARREVIVATVLELAVR